MSNSQLEVKRLRDEVQLLRDELAIMKRKYEDIIYNLDTDNFSSRFVKEQGNMRTAIEVNAKGINTKVSSEEFESTKIQTAQKIESEVKTLSDADKALSAKITQTADTIRSEVKSTAETIEEKFDNYSTIELTDSKISASAKETIEYAEGYITDLLANGDYVTGATFQSQFDIYADKIYSTVEETYETKDDADASYSTLRGSISSIEQTASGIRTRVDSLEDGEFNGYTLFEQTADKFSFTGNVEISGNAIVGGVIKGSSLKNTQGTHTLKMLGQGDNERYGTFCLYNSNYVSVPYFSVYDNTLGGISLYGAGSPFLSVENNGGIVAKPKGSWDFSGCSSIDWGDFGTGGGTTVAVFG